MPNDKHYSDLITQTARRSVEATTSILGITNKHLRKHLGQELNKTGLGLLADPVFESTFPWETGNKMMKNLSSNLLNASLVNAMDNAGEHRFGKDWYPFKHQLKSWSTALEEKKSLVVTSGTGSGKTECFMVPILNDLVQEYEDKQSALIGVRALFIYPLNALINSQRERLLSWTEAYDDGLRFCLYNGNTKERKHPEQHKYPNEILTRKLMRESPAPMLVTNSTMLEYMLVRQIDNPIIEQSYGKLRWIILDEAHSYVGSQAAELSLLLRRTMHTFGVEAKDVRFVATSATIGGVGAEKKLQEYLASLSGVNIDQVVVVPGKRAVPKLPKQAIEGLSLEGIRSIDKGEHFSNERYAALIENKHAIKLRNALTKTEIPSKLSGLAKELFNDESKIIETLAWVDVCSNTSKPGPNTKNPSLDSEAFLPVRGHLFHQVLSGLWCCSDKNCSQKTGTALAEEWPFGYVYSQRKEKCKCGAPIYELLFCNECNTPHLLAMENNGYLIQKESESVDEFSLDYESTEESDDESDIPNLADIVILAPKVHVDLTYSLSIDSEQKRIPTGANSLDLNAIITSDLACTKCEYTGFKANFYRRSLLGTPFYISNNIPALLDICDESDKANERPSRGKRLITFTDNRQGTARISVKIQQDSERNSIRSLIYGITANNISPMDSDELTEKKNKQSKYLEKAEKYKKTDADLASELEELANEITTELEQLGTISTLSWNDTVTKVHASPDIEKWIFDYYSRLNPQLFPENGGSRVLTEMLLLREFARRPKRQNSMETLGLVSVQYPALQEIKKIPEEWKKLGLSLSDWVDFLKVTLDFYIRENTIIDIPSDWVNWMGARVYPKTVLKPNSDESTSSRIRRWPQINKGRNNRLIRMLCFACNLDIKSPLHVDQINSVMTSAWKALTARYQKKNEQTSQTEVHQILKPRPGTVEYNLDRSEIAFKVCETAWVCPYTHRLLDATFKGISPYLPFNANKKDIICREVSMSICQMDESSFNSDLERKLAIREWLLNQENITALREENLWTDISDGIVEGGKFIRTAEHSAQQPASKLIKYENDFKQGRLNVLNCSTTMEMGVDIGGISVVGMNNVPPHPANYLQRSGRAGRRGETQALSFTICKDNPHERSVFADPLWPFKTTIAAPYITLDSNRIVQRHINSLILSFFLKETLSIKESATNLTCEWFFTNDDMRQSPIEKLLRLLQSFAHKPSGIPKSLDEGIKQVIRGSILAGVPREQIINNSIESLNKAKEQWLPGFLKLKDELEKLVSINDKDPFKRKLTYDLKSMGGEYLLAELASRAFLPGYGFPTGIATFDNYSVSSYKLGKYVNNTGRIDNQMRMRERPGRDISIAIREYAPGSEVVIDGLVYRSAGILINKFSPGDDYSDPQKMLVEWRCRSCGAIGNETLGTFENCCTDCGSSLNSEDIKEYIEPIGFAVDFYSSPTTDISSQMYIPTQEPWVTADSKLNMLFEPMLGSYRNSSHGHIFNHTSGEHGTGFAVCLNCGKTESMTVDGDYPENLQPGKEHKKLQGRPDAESSLMCEGSDATYAIKNNQHLGAIDQTDVYELYLKNPSDNLYIKHHNNDPLSWTLAVALRQALADIHGINAEEMGYTVKPSTLLGCNYPVAGVVLYDKNGGGSGFSSAAPRHIQNMFLKALQYLECADDCESACQSCLLGYDTRFHTNLLNRHVAIEYITKILPYLEIKPEANVFGVKSKYCLEPLNSEILICSNQENSKLKIFTNDTYTNWRISDSRLKETCLNWLNTFHTVELVLPTNNLDSMNETHKEDLLALKNLGVRLSYLESHLLPTHKGSFLAQISNGDKVTSFATNSLDATIPNEGWWKFDDFYLIKTNEIKEIQTNELDSKLLSTQIEQGDIEIELKSELNGPLEKFGDKLWNKLIDESAIIKDSLNGSRKLKAITYTDSYICSPWSLLLFSKVIHSLKDRSESWNNPVINLFTGEKTPSPYARGLYAEWKINDLRASVLSSYMKKIGLETNIKIKPIKELPHGRTLLIEWDNNETTFIRFDHGIGCWSIAKAPKKYFDVDANTDCQVKTLLAISKNIEVKYNKKFPTQLFIKHRK